MSFQFKKEKSWFNNLNSLIGASEIFLVKTGSGVSSFSSANLSWKEKILFVPGFEKLSNKEHCPMKIVSPKFPSKSIKAATASLLKTTGFRFGLLHGKPMAIALQEGF